MTDVRTAGIVSRVIAALIDLLVVVVIQGSIFLALALVRLAVHVGGFSLPSYAWLWGSTMFVVLCIGYLAPAWAAFGRTVGQVVMGLGVVGLGSGRRPGFVRALGRAALCTFVPIGLLWVAVSPRRASLQDIALRTRVVYTHEPVPALATT
ncbi:MAG: RDD family protein [Gordonia sp. (in: high G+C Gram-positive bacteria)]|uniref:RDD family protein n=1 Tax=Gordonia sp. (in: high G+C Gram-positive bacteria) TaxID=84139 RepID=UPI0039E6426E